MELHTVHCRQHRPWSQVSNGLRRKTWLCTWTYKKIFGYTDQPLRLRRATSDIFFLGGSITRSAVWQVRAMLDQCAASHSVTVSRWALPPSPPPVKPDAGIYISLSSSSYSSSSVLAVTWVCDPPPPPYFVWRRLLIIPSQNPVSNHRTSFVIPPLSLLYWALRHWCFLVLLAMGFSGLYFASSLVW